MSVTYKNRLVLEPKFVTTGLSKDNAAATANGTTIDLGSAPYLAQGPYAEGLILAELEAITGGPSATSVKFRLEHSDDNTTFTPVTAPETVQAETLDFTAAGIKTLAFRPQGLKRYIRVSISTLTLTGGTSPAVKLRVLLVLDVPRFV